ncbi:serine/threonine-protein phosphatase [Candidatus Woesearchaeota archaeon]|nr:serine/threonine-protein phosphatase [Candidatus Woesearchaeota archaeon]
MSFRIRATSGSLIGARENNEDAHRTRAPSYIVADGMGGHPCGDVASELVVSVLSHAQPRCRTSMRQAFHQVPLEMQKAVRHGRGSRLMGSTGTMLYFDVQKGFVLMGHVGDSRAYVMGQNGPLEQLSRDHTVFAELTRQGVDVSRIHPVHGACLSQSISPKSTHDDEYNPQILARTLCAGDTYLLCSDGVHGQVEFYELERLITCGITGTQLAKRAVENSERSDNATAIIIRVEAA